LFVCNDNNRILVFDSGAGDDAVPARTLFGAATGLSTPRDIAVMW